MENIWSEKRYINLIINVLIFLLGINFMHYGQLIIPIICLLLFIDNKFRFQVNSVITFVILCLFGISFFIFTYKQGLFAFIGLFMPMAYYIGSNIKTINENNVKNIIYIFTFGMITHVLLNFGFDLFRKGLHIFFSTSHYDIWTLSDISETATSINYVFMYGLTYFLFIFEKNKLIKTIFVIFFVISSIYCVALGERTIILLLAISIIISIVLSIIYGEAKYIKKVISYLLTFILILVIIMIVLNSINNLNYNYSVLDMRLLGKFINKGFKTERLSILLETIKYAPRHLWGGNEISSIVGIMPHDFWSDVFDWAGIIPFVLILIYTALCIYTFIRILKCSRISNDFKIFIIPFLICIVLQMLLEPILSGASTFVLIIIVVMALLERLVNDEK